MSLCVSGQPSTIQLLFIFKHKLSLWCPWCVCGLFCSSAIPPYFSLSQLSFPQAGITGETCMLTGLSRPISTPLISVCKIYAGRAFKVRLPFLSSFSLLLAAVPHCVQCCSEAVIKGVTEDLGHHTREKKIKAVFSALVAVAKYKRWRGGKKFIKESGLIHSFDSVSVVGI